jgi:hypothetical protein
MNKKVWIVSIDMGYGHQRTAYPLKFLAQNGEIISANNYKEIPEKDRKIWKSSRAFYEAVSRFKKFPLLGEIAFYLFDLTQKINSFYTKKNLSSSAFTQRRTESLFKRGWGKHFVEKLDSDIPFVSSFYNTAFMAEYFNYKGDIYCIVCDTDISRSWAPLSPKKSRIKYFTPNNRTTKRLKAYGVKEENIILTGYPLPLENIEEETLKEDMKNRIINLDPCSKYREKYDFVIREKLGKLPLKSNHPLTIMFAVGGAGAQKEIGIKLVRKFKKELSEKKVKIILVAGIKKKIKDYFEKEIVNGGLGNFLNHEVEVLYDNNFSDYYDKFNLALRKTDILWTKPSELSFYAALGLPIIIAQPIGSQEDFNRRWLLKSGFGMDERDIGHAREWMYDLLDAGYLAEMAMEAFIEGNRDGTIKIKEHFEK